MAAKVPRLAELFDLSGRVALITGGSRGLGLEIAEGLGEAGARVVITARREADLRAAAETLRQAGVEVLALPGSVAEPSDVERWVQETRGRFGRIDILVNNAGVTWGAATLEMPYERWRYVMETNVNGTWLLSQAVCRALVEQGEGGRVINVASLAGLRGGRAEDLPVIGYSTSKAAVIGMTRTLATHMAPHRIRVNAIAPGFFPTRMSRGVLDAIGERIAAEVPLGRIGRPGELKGVVVFLASDASSYITGQVISVDGGATA